MKFPASLALLSLAAGCFSACQSGDAVVRNAEDEVFTIHDGVMPQLDDLARLRRQLTQYVAHIDSTHETGSAATMIRLDEEKAQAIRLVQNLAVADSLMTHWMDHYDNDTLTRIPTDDALRYLAGQKDKITDVRTKVNSSIDQAQQFLAKK